MQRQRRVPRKAAPQKVSYRKHFWLGGVALLTLVALVWCSKKDEMKGDAESASPASVAAVSAAVPSSGSVGSVPAVGIPQTRTLTILPPEPTAQDPLLAVFQGSSGRVEYHWVKNGEPIAGEGRERLSAGHFVKGDVITAIVDNEGVSYSASTTIGNRLPVVVKASFKNPTLHRGVDIALDVTGDDPDGDQVSFAFQWYLNGRQVDFVDGPVLPGDRFQRGDGIHFLVTPSDSAGEGIPYEGTVFVIPNAPPSFVSSPPMQFLGNSYRYQARAEDADGDEITYSLESPPPGMTIQGKTGQIAWELIDLPDGEYRITIVAEDSEGQKGYQEYTFALARK